MRDRLTPISHSGITVQSKFSEIAELWLKDLEASVSLGNRSPTTLDTYRGRLYGLILPAMGELRVREITVLRVEQLCHAVQKNQSVDSARTVRNILSGVCTVAVRHKALGSNPVRDMAPLEGKRKASRALDADEMKDLLGKLDRSEFAIRHDLPDLARWYTGTGFRTGEGLAVSWKHLDLDVGTATWAGNLIRAKGTGNIVNDGKTDVSERALALPAWLVSMLRERRTRLAARLGSAEDDLDGPVFPDTLGDYGTSTTPWRAGATSEVTPVIRG